jgi:hypothetical protein
MTLQIICTFTESPSFNVRVLHNGITIFYNSERLQGNERLRKLGAILGFTSLKVGEITFLATQEQYNQIASL